mmetsp:Transcript_33933/g.78253  ORF Transcript_33933/g.78253 Transcript_33933/m.78253 type:complete len:270 (+) Transcript_33933:1084-1893(+)
MMLLVVTGASRGLGQAIAVAFCKEQQLRSASIRALLVARSKEGMKATRKKMGIACSNTEVRVTLHEMDLSDLMQLDGNIDSLLEDSKPFSQYKQIVVINNAGSLGHLGPAADTPSLQSLQRYMDLNVTSSLWLTSRLSKELMEFEDRTTIVNISSLCAIEPFPTMAGYCAAKAARDMFHAAMAKEPGVKVLNYAPGVLDTDMSATLRQCDALDDGLHAFFNAAHQKGELIPPEKTAEKLVRLVMSGDFQNGAHVDYWDIDDQGNKKSEK